MGPYVATAMAVVMTMTGRWQCCLWAKRGSAAQRCKGHGEDRRDEERQHADDAVADAHVALLIAIRG